MSEGVQSFEYRQFIERQGVASVAADVWRFTEDEGGAIYYAAFTLCDGIGGTVRLQFDCFDDKRQQQNIAQIDHLLAALNGLRAEFDKSARKAATEGGER